MFWFLFIFLFFGVLFYWIGKELFDIFFEDGNAKNKKSHIHDIIKKKKK
jgi:hypothetical protein